jgi:hypothetical protein
MATLKYPKVFYEASNLRQGSMSRKEMRAEYSRLRSIGIKRLKRFEGTEFETSLTYQRNVDQYPKLSEIREVDLPYKLENLSRFISARSGTITGIKQIKQQALNTLRYDKGYTFLNERNFSLWCEFMELYREHRKDIEYDSEQIAEVAEGFARKRLSVEEAFDAPEEIGSSVEAVFRWWVENKQKIQRADDEARAKHKKTDRTPFEYEKHFKKWTSE